MSGLNVGPPYHESVSLIPSASSSVKVRSICAFWCAFSFRFLKQNPRVAARMKMIGMATPNAIPVAAPGLSLDGFGGAAMVFLVAEADAMTEDAIVDAAAGEMVERLSKADGETASNVSPVGAEQPARVSPQQYQELEELLYTMFCKA